MGSLQDLSALKARIAEKAFLEALELAKSGRIVEAANAPESGSRETPVVLPLYAITGSRDAG